MKTNFPKIVCTDQILWGSPRIDGRRLAVGDVISALNISGLKDVLEDYELTKSEIKEALQYCSSLQCKMDKPKVFCHNCSLERDRDGPLDITKYQEEKIGDDYIVQGNGMTFLGSMNEFLKDCAGQDFWKISTDLLIDIGQDLE